METEVATETPWNRFGLFLFGVPCGGAVLWALLNLSAWLGLISFFAPDEKSTIGAVLLLLFVYGPFWRGGRANVIFHAGIGFGVLFGLSVLWLIHGS